MDDRDFDDVAIRWQEAMQRGDFEGAWQQTDRIEHERRAAEAQGAPIARSQHLLWNGAAFDGARVRVRCNHGLGDTLQFVRYLPLLQARARSVLTLVQPHLLRLLDCGVFGPVQNGWTEAPPSECDVEIEVMELPYAFRSTAANLPACVPYIPLPHVQGFASSVPPLASDGALNVGLVWGSSDWDTSRSIPLSALAPLCDVPGLRVHGLQQGAPLRDMASSPIPITDWSPYTAAIEVAAAAMLALDVIVTVDCMMAHLAGALGRRVLVMLKHDADWRWMRDRSDSPWYPTMRLLRQPRPGSWRAVGEAVAGALAALV